MNHPFTDEEMLIILEAANVGLSDADSFDALAEKMDIADDRLMAVRDKLQKFMRMEE